MTARILVVDAVPTNRIVLRVKLATAFYEVVQVATGKEAIKALRKHSPDLVIASTTLPDMSGKEFCATLRGQSFAPRLPIVLVHNDDDPGERLACLAAGADDVLARPIDDLVMLARLRSLLRARDAEAELQLRDDTRRALGLAEQSSAYQAPARVAIVPPSNTYSARRLQQELRGHLTDKIDVVDPDNLLAALAPPPDVIVLIEAVAGQGESLQVLPQLRASTETRHAAIIYVAHSHQRREAASALDMGANDLLASGPDAEELALRLRKQIARKRTADRLRENMRDGLRAAVTDPLTGLYNRRYAMPHLKRFAERAAKQNRPYAVLLADLDHFKSVNDHYGHPGGDVVLVELADLLRDNLRAADLVARFGGEEFLIAMPDTGREAAMATAQRLCQVVANTPVPLPDRRQVSISLSIGVAISEPGPVMMPPETLINNADRALYAAKDKGRNTVVMSDTVTVLPQIRPTSLASVTQTLRKASGATHD